jgi:hypothetical protein
VPNLSLNILRASSNKEIASFLVTVHLPLRLERGQDYHSGKK